MNWPEFWVQVAANVSAGIFISILYFTFGEKVFGLPQVSGCWLVEGWTSATAYRPFQGMKITYMALLAQQGSEIHGYGEKIKEIAGEVAKSYTGANRVQIEIEGYITKRYFRRNRFVFLIREHGVSRPSSTVHMVSETSAGLAGMFVSTIADSSGTVTWTRSS
jgi:hypothetical protein